MVPTSEQTQRPDPLRRGVQVALALYLAPVIGLVGLIGLTAMTFEALARAARRLTARSRQGVLQGHLEIVGPNSQRMTPRVFDRPRRTRVSR